MESAASSGKGTKKAERNRGSSIGLDEEQKADIEAIRGHLSSRSGFSVSKGQAGQYVVNAGIRTCKAEFARSETGK